MGSDLGRGGEFRIAVVVNVVELAADSFYVCFRIGVKKNSLDFSTDIVVIVSVTPSLTCSSLASFPMLLPQKVLGQSAVIAGAIP